MYMVIILLCCCHNILSPIRKLEHGRLYIITHIEHSLIANNCNTDGNNNIYITYL